MNKQIFILAMTALGFVACSSDETIATQATSEANEISFRPLVNNTTRATTATDATLTNISPFDVTAFTTGNEASTPYINNVTYTTDNNGSGTYYVGGSSTAAGQYYWPSSNLDFFAYKTTVSTEVVRQAYNVFDVTPTATTSDDITQGDLVYAALSNVGKADYGASGVPLGFKHAATKISVMLKNTKANLDFEVFGWKIVNVKNSGRFTYDHGVLSSRKGTQDITNAMWTDLSTSANPPAAAPTISTSYKTLFSKTINGIAEPSGTADPGDDPIGSMILIPQTLTPATAYSSSSTGSDITTGTYLAVKMRIKNHSDETVIAYADDQVDSKDKWAMWPVPAMTWVPGLHYIYTIDLGDGGYWELNNDGGDTNFDPIIANSVIKFASVTVENWRETGETNIPSTASQNVAAGTTNTNIAVGYGATGTYTFTITGLTEGDSYTIDASNNLVLLSNYSGTVSGTSVTFTVNLKANTGETTNTITFTDYTNSDKNTTITITQAGS